METSARLGLPYVMAGQAQKHITVNEALERLDALAQLACLSATTTAEPASPATGDTYILPAGATGALWETMAEGSLAAFLTNTWIEVPARAGLRAWVIDTGDFLVFDGSAWVPLEGTAGSAPTFGINATADATNRLAVKSDAELLSHDDVTPGSGDARKLINKAAAGNTASVVFQNGFSGRAEFGLTGDDDFHGKVSPDGATFYDGYIIDKDDGTIRFPNGIRSDRAGALLQGLVGVPEIGAQKSIAYRLNHFREQNPRTAVIDSISADTITLATADAIDFFDDSLMRDVSYIRVWNISKSPEEAAWVRAQPAGDQLQVTDPAALSGWANGETLQVGDPTSVTAGRAIAVDISPMLQQQFGSVFRTAGILCVYVAAGDTASLSDTQSVSISVSPNGLGGSYISGSSNAKGNLALGILYAPTAELSPVSNSNLLYVREYTPVSGGTLGICEVKIIGILLEG